MKIFNFQLSTFKLQIVIAVLAILGSHASAQNTSLQRQRLEQHVYTLAADSLNGRLGGSPDAQRAAAYITRQWRDMGLKPFPGNNDKYNMPFELRGESGFSNLVAIIEGNDPVLKYEYIVIGGHYDHLGVRNGKIYNGADDNASGTACVTEVARQLLAQQSKLKRSVIVCAFDAEEMGLCGSSALAEYMEKNNLLDRVKLMMSIDMVGWLKQGGSLHLEGTGTLLHSNQLTDPELLGIPIKISTKRFENSVFTATDTEPFAKRGVPTLAVTTGLKSPYHKPEDDADLIDYEGLSLVTDYMAAFTLRAANQPGQLVSGQVAPKHRDKTVPFNLGLCLGYNSHWLRFPDAAFDGKSLLGWHAGIAMQCNFNNHIALHADVLYTNTRSPYPDVHFLYDNILRLRQQSVTVPLMLRYSVGGRSSDFYISFGGYYSHSINSQFYFTEEVADIDKPSYTTSPQPCRTNQWGLGWDFGFRLGYNWDLRCAFFYQLNPLFNDAAMPRTLNTCSSFTLTYYLL